jgi:hypothetical protein
VLIHFTLLSLLHLQSFSLLHEHLARSLGYGNEPFAHFKINFAPDGKTSILLSFASKWTPLACKNTGAGQPLVLSDLTFMRLNGTSDDIFELFFLSFFAVFRMRLRRFRICFSVKLMVQDSSSFSSVSYSIYSMSVEVLHW